MKYKNSDGEILLMILAVLTLVTTISLGLAGQIINSRQQSKIMEISTKTKAASESTNEKIIIGEANIPSGSMVTKTPDSTQGLGLKKQLKTDVASTYFLRDYDIETGDFNGNGIQSDPALCLSSDISAIEISLISKSGGDFVRKFFVFSEGAYIPGSVDFIYDDPACGVNERRISIVRYGESYLLTARAIAAGEKAESLLIFGDSTKIPQGRLITSNNTKSGVNQSETVFQEYPQLLPMLLQTRF